MRLIGNKTHGDLAEIGIAEFINQFMYDYESVHVGKDLFRAKEHEEDIVITDEISKESFPVSLKAYGDGPLQLSTDSNQKLFPFLQAFHTDVIDESKVSDVFDSEEFSSFKTINVMPLIYDEESQRCNIMVFNYEKAIRETVRVLLIQPGKRFDHDTGNVVDGKGRKHPIFLFVNDRNEYICEVRYGGAAANALQRGLWTHTKKASDYFESLTNGWIDYSHNLILVKLFSLALNSSETGHTLANAVLQDDIDELRRKW